ncbi:hypothetical protein [Litorilituus sediminis]|uniref:Uncharacterized protein n=1 Tax=Litorilituus sediminis TaxID=718192 RepID=A0A4P6P2X3_9GAMM|nr:hypothetical protein [Litorilituus sediminis]QBG35671.1 hypothetical protein EMK97_08090 [Litorilituus sediminis]
MKRIEVEQLIRDFCSGDKDINMNEIKDAFKLLNIEHETTSDYILQLYDIPNNEKEKAEYIDTAIKEFRKMHTAINI